MRAKFLIRGDVIVTDRTGATGDIVNHVVSDHPSLPEGSVLIVGQDMVQLVHSEQDITLL